MLNRARIGSWTATPALNLLERGAQSIRLEPRAMDVLMQLARRPGQVVSIEELMASVWKGVVVGEGSVYLAIRQLRQALEEDAEGSRYIETIRKRGYRLVAPVDAVGAVEAAEAANATESVETAVRKSVVPWRLAMSAALAVALFVTVIAFVRREAQSPASEISVAVLPFSNLSSDREQDYFADGVTTEILTALSGISDLRVTGRASSFQFKGRDEDPGRIAALLGVEHILEGSVRRTADRLRISAQLSSAKTGLTLWSQTYENGLDDIFQVQDEIARSVANALQVKLGVGDLARVPGMTRNVAAYDQYLRGIALNLDWRPESFALAIVHLQRAVALDPAFSAAWSALHAVYSNGAFAVPERADEWRSSAVESLARARALTPDAPHVLLETGIEETRSGQWRAAAGTFEQLQAAYARHGLNNQGWGPRGAFLLGVGRVREAIPALERARAEEPLAPAFAGFLGEASLANGDPAGALLEVDRGLTLEGLDDSLRWMALVIALTQNDRREIDKRLAALAGANALSRIQGPMTALLDAPAGAEAQIRRLAATAGPGEKGLLVVWAAYFRAPELGLELLDEAAPHLGHPGLLWHPLLKDMRKRAAFNEIVRNLGLVDYWRAYGWADFCRPVQDDFLCE